MSCCTGRCFFITWCFLQLLVTLERQVFDFLGFMWAPIIVNFLHIIFVIVGIFGAYQYRHRIIIVYALWSLLWIGWNIFVICFYLQIGSLHREMSILNLGTKNKSWWLEHGIGCEVDKVAQPRIAENSLTERNMPHEEDVSGCLIEYYYVEVIQAAIHCLLALVGICVAIYLCRIFLEENDSSFWESQLVHDELEYVKMRYQEPSRNSCQTYKTYATPMAYTTTDERQAQQPPPHTSETQLPHYVVM